MPDDYTATILQMRNRATGQATGAAQVSPGAAATAIATSPDNPSAAMYNPEQPEIQQQKTNAAIVQRSPAMARWAQSPPAHVAASADSFPWLETFSNAVNYMTYGIPKEIEAEVTGAAHEIVSPAAPTPLPKEYSAATELENWLAAHIPGQRQLAGAIKAVAPRVLAAGAIPAAAIAAPATQLIGEPIEQMTGFPKRATGQILTMLAPIAGLGLKAALPAEAVAEAKPVTPAAQAAESSASVLDAMHSAVQKSPVQGRSPETMKEFVNQQVADTPVETVGISADKIKEIYDRAGIAPSPDDKILGWIPDLGPKLASGLESGGEVQVPLADYLTKVPENLHNELKDSNTFAGAPSVEEAKLAEEPKVEGMANALNASAIPEPALSQARAAVKNRYLNQLFADAKAAGMTEDQFQRYSKAVEAQTQMAYDRVVELARQQGSREQNVEWKTAAAKIEPQVRAELEKSPAIRARDLRTGHPDPEILAESLGFGSAEEMDKAIAPLEADRGPKGFRTESLTLKEHFEKLVERETNRRVTAQLGSKLSRDQIREAVRSTLHAPEAKDLLVTELRSLAQLANLPFSKPAVEFQAERLFEKLPVNEAANVRAWERGVLREGRKAEVALLKKNKVADAFQAKQRQLMNVYMLEQAHALVKERALAMKRYARLAKSPTLTGFDQSWLNHIHDLLGAFGYEVAREPRELRDSLAGVTTPDFVQRQIADGRAVFFDPRPGDLKKMSVEDFRSTKNTFYSFIHNARLQDSLMRGITKQEFGSQIIRVRDQFDDRKGRKLTDAELYAKAHNQGFFADYGANLGDMQAYLRAPEFMINELDNGNPFGVFTDVLLRPIQDAKHLETDLEREINNAHKEFAKKEPPDWKRSLQEKIDAGLTFTTEDGSKINVVPTRRELIAAAMHYGSESGKDKLLLGYDWNANDLEAAFDKYLRPHDLDFIEHMWGIFEKLWPHAEAMTRKLSGIAPPKLVKAPFEVAGRQMSGGYNWAIYDETLTPEHLLFDHSMREPFDNNYYRATPPRGYTKERTGYAAPLDLNIDSLNRRIAQIIHDVAFREPILNATNFLRNAVVKRTIQKSLGPSYPEQFNAWVTRVARAATFDTREMQGWENFVRAARMNMVAVQLMFRASTVAKHGASAAVKSTNEIGAAALSRGFNEWLQHPVKANEMIKGKSAEMRARADNFDRDARTAYQRLFEKQGFVTQIQHYGFHLVAGSDWASAAPTWLGAYRKALSAGEAEPDAVYLADRAVRRAHGAGHSVDLPNAFDQRGPLAEFWRALTPFMTFFSNTYQQLIEAGQQDFLRALARTSLLVGGIGGVEALVSGQFKDKPKQFAKELGEDGLLVLTGGLPLARDAVQFLYAKATGLHDFGYHAAPEEQIIETLGKTIAGEGIKHGHVRGSFIKNAVTSYGYLTGTPTGQLGTTAEYVWDWSHGRVKPSGPMDIASGLAFGPHYKEHHK